MGVDGLGPERRVSDVARKTRIEYPGAIYHVMNRGDRREAIFKDDSDRERFLETLGEACAKTSWRVQAYCLMGNHFHLVMETPEANLVAGMKWFWGHREELLGQMRGRMGEHHYGEERRESAEEKAQRVVREELRKSGWKLEELARAEGRSSESGGRATPEARNDHDAQMDQPASADGGLDALEQAAS